MTELAYDLHIHSCLSPCGDDDMTPANIAGMAALKGLCDAPVCIVPYINLLKNIFINQFLYGHSSSPSSRLSREDISSEIRRMHSFNVFKVSWLLLSLL